MKQRSRLVGVLSLLLLAALTPPAVAGTFYIDAVNGSNANTGTSWGDSWSTISHAVASTAYDDTLLIAPGTYDAGLGETFPIDMQARRFHGVAGPSRTIVDGGGSSVLFTGSHWEGEAVIQGLWLRNGSRAVDLDVACYMYDCVSQLTLRDVIISNMSDVGVHGHMWTDWLDASLLVNLERVIIEQCGKAFEIDATGITNHPDTPPTAYGTLVCTDSLIRDNGSGVTGFGSGDPGANWVSLDIWRCTFTGNAGMAITAGWDAHANVRNSILFGNGGDISGDTVVRYSNTEHSTFPGIGNISTDPLFLDPFGGDHRLVFGSPCVDRGDPVEPPGWDLAGSARPVDGDLNARERVDMGAYELAPLSLTGVPAIGTTVQLEFWGPANGVSTLYWLRGAPVTPIPTPYGEYELGFPRSAFATVATAPGPPVALPLTIPADPALVGLSFSFQGLSTSGTPFWPPMALTNVVTLTVVR